MGTNTGGFASRLRELRLRAGLSQSQLATKASLHLHGVTKLEHGDREPTWQTVLALAHALGVDCTAFTETAKQKPGAKSTKKGRPRKSN